MQIRRSKVIGFCAGVRRAVTMAEANPNSFVVGGDIVHNPFEVSRLEKNYNIVGAPDIADVNDTAIIRAHGVAESVISELNNRDVKIIDATCVNVKRVQQIAKEFSKNGYHLFILGDAAHPETIGIVGHTNGNVTVLSKAAELENIELPSKRALISQTTKSESEFKAAEKILRPAEVVNTICPAMKTNLDAAIELAHASDIMIIIGGKKSSNTRVLSETVRAYCTDCHSIESADDILPEWFIGKSNCGIAAGLSTPDYLIDAVEERLKTL